MAIIDNKDLIDLIIKNDGHYEGDPQVYQIVEYINAYGNTTWGVTWTSETMQRRHRYEIESQYISKPKIIYNCDRKQNVQNN